MDENTNSNDLLAVELSTTANPNVLVNSYIVGLYEKIINCRDVNENATNNDECVVIALSR